MATKSFTHFMELELGKFPHFLIYAFLELVLILVLFIDGFLAFFANEFAKFFQLRLPCMLCTRIDHFLVDRADDFYYNNSICESHKKHVSCLIYCHNHKKLSDINKMCESCLLSFAPDTSSESHTYKPLVRNLHHDNDLFANNRQDHRLNLSAGIARKDEQMLDEKSSIHRCSCCGEPLEAQLKEKETRLGSQAPTPSPRAEFTNLRNELQNMDLSITKLKFRDNESELQDVEDCPDESLGKQCGEVVKAASVSLLTEAEDMHEETTPMTEENMHEDRSPRSPGFGILNKLFGMPFSDSAPSTPRSAMRSPRKSVLGRTEFTSRSTERNELERPRQAMRTPRRSLLERTIFASESIEGNIAEGPRQAMRSPRRSLLERTMFASESIEENEENESEGDVLLHHMNGRAKLAHSFSMRIH